MALVSETSTRILELMRVQVRLQGEVPLLSKNRAFLVIGNHSSYLDMLILAKHYPCLFVSSEERRGDGGIGQLAELSGTVFVDRKNKSRLREDIRSIAAYLERGIPLCLYLEGTTSNGRSILPFKSSLLRSVEERDIEILPICLRYTHIDGKPLEGRDFDQVAWYGDMTFLPHFRSLANKSSIAAELQILAPLRAKEKQNRKAIAAAAEEQIRAAFFDGRANKNSK